MLDQIEKELKFEKIFHIYKKYRKLINNIAFGLSIVFGALTWWNFEKSEQTEKSSMQLLQAISAYEKDDLEKAQYILDHMPSKYETEYMMLARFLAADLALKNNKPEDAKKLYEKIIQTANDSVYRNIAKMKSLFLNVYDMPEAEAMKEIDEISNAFPSFKTMLLELKAIYFSKKGDKEKAAHFYAEALKDEKDFPVSEMRLKLSDPYLTC